MITKEQLMSIGNATIAYMGSFPIAKTIPPALLVGLTAMITKYMFDMILKVDKDATVERIYSLMIEIGDDERIKKVTGETNNSHKEGQTRCTQAACRFGDR